MIKSPYQQADNMAAAITMSVQKHYCIVLLLSNGVTSYDLLKSDINIKHSRGRMQVLYIYAMATYQDANIHLIQQTSFSLSNQDPNCLNNIYYAVS